MERDKFITTTCILAGLISILFAAKVFQEEYVTATIIVIIANVLYIPGALTFGKKCFIYWSTVYGILLIFLIANYQSTLLNNYTALFPLIIAMLVKPKYKTPLFIVYLISVSAAFILTDVSILNYLIHITRSYWILYILDYYLNNKFERRQLELKPDEIKILNELNEKKLLKAVTCFSKNTITQKLKEARERNNIDTNAELLAEYNLMLKK